MTAAPPAYTQARADTAAMLGYDLASLTAEQATRLDVAAALRLAVDDQSGKLARGETADVSKLLSASEALARLLPPLREPPPSTKRDDLAAREAAIAPLLKLFRQLHEQVRTLSHENAQLKAALAGGSTVITPTDSDIVPPGEIGECYAGVRAGPDDPRQPSVIEGKAVQPSATAARNVPVLVECVCDPSPEEPWRDFVEPDGSIRATPRGPGRYWGPV